jgi:nucleoside-diphosphate-sugar epimerase
MPTALVFGGSGQIGVPLLHRLSAAGWDVAAVSRHAQAPIDGVRWLRGGFEGADGMPATVDAIFSCGPLDSFGRWLASQRIEFGHVVAFGSTTAEVKQDSSDEGERDLAQRLQAGESGVLDATAARGVPAVLLRPTLVYGSGRDQTLTRIAALAARWRGFVLPRKADGLRQPVHVEDLAAAAFAAASATATATYALGGGEVLPYRLMVKRVLGALRPPARLIEVPAPLFAWMLSKARARGLDVAIGDAAIARMREDLVFDLAPAQRDLGYAPRAFRPTAAMFAAPARGAAQ